MKIKNDNGTNFFLYLQYSNIHTTISDEIANLRKHTDLNVKMLDTKHNALGNLICVNDKGGIISPIVEKEFIKEIADVLDIEVIQKRVAGYHQVGAVMEANNLGGVIHPETDEEDIKNFSNVLGVDIEPATINGGIPFVSSGILANKDRKSTRLNSSHT